MMNRSDLAYLLLLLLFVCYFSFFIVDGFGVLVDLFT